MRPVQLINGSWLISALEILRVSGCGDSLVSGM